MPEEAQKLSRFNLILIMIGTAAVLAVLIIIIGAVLQKEKPLPQQREPEAAQTPAAATQPFIEPAPAEPAPSTEDRKGDILNNRVNVSHILIAHTDAMEVEGTIKLNKEQAFNVALEIINKLKAEPQSFHALAREYSDDRATGVNGGYIPPFNLRDVAPAFREAIIKLQPGEISDIVETPFGYHIIKLETVEEAILQSILIQYSGALQAPDRLERSEGEALELVTRIYQMLQETDASFDDLARTYSEDPWAQRGGWMQGIVRRGSIPHEIMESTAFGLAPGTISSVFRTPLGFHILKRHPIEYRQACQIVILYGGESGRTQERARRKAEAVHREIGEGMEFQEAVQKYSDGPVEKTEGFTPVIYRGTWVPRLEDQLFSMKTGAISKPIELSTAYVIIARVR